MADAGRRCVRFAKPDMGNRFFTRAADHADVNPFVLVTLAEFEEGHSRLDSALRFLDRALAMQPGHPAALLVRSRVHRISGELERGESLLRSLLAKPESNTSAMAWYELGTNLDRQGSYDDAMK